MENDFEKQWERLRSRRAACPLDDEELMLRARRAIDTAGVRHWWWLPYAAAAAVMLSALSVPLRSAAAGHGMSTHNISPADVVRANNELLNAL